MTRQLDFSDIITSNRDYGRLLTKSQWDAIRRQLSSADLADLNRGKAVKYQGTEIRKTTKGNSNG